jgi:hypothetical protein
MTQTIFTIPSPDVQQTYVGMYIDRLNPKNRHHRALIKFLYLLLHGKSPKAVMRDVKQEKGE